jgi:hypothetical protein
MVPMTSVLDDADVQALIALVDPQFREVLSRAIVRRHRTARCCVAPCDGAIGIVCAFAGGLFAVKPHPSSRRLS